jgi:hypothetical protein
MNDNLNKESAFSYMAQPDPSTLMPQSTQETQIAPLPGQMSVGPAMPPSPFSPREMQTGSQIFGQPLPNSFDRQMQTTNLNNIQ